MPIVMVLVMVFLSLTIRYCRFFICLAMIVLINMTRIPNYGHPFFVTESPIHTYTLLY